MRYRFISWNIDSLNAALAGDSQRSGLTLAVVERLAAEAPDLLAIQETKLSEDPRKTEGLLRALAVHFPDHEAVHRVSTPPARKGYAGTLVLYRRSLPSPVVTYPVIDAPETMDLEGRIITLEFPDFFVTTVYTPNSGNELNRLEPRGVWDDCYRAYLAGLDRTKPVIAGGDFNVAHAEVDLAHPGSNHNSSGFTDAERQKFGQLLSAGFVDSFRRLHPDATGFYEEGRSSYTWFPQRARQSKANNSGWRIDYWLVSDRLADAVSRCEPLDTGARLDHLPVLLEFEL